MTADDDVERAVLFVLHSPPSFEGDYDDPWFTAGPVPESAIADRLRSLSGASDTATDQALSRLEAEGLIHRSEDRTGDGAPPAGWALTDQGAARAERLPDRYLAEFRSREPEPADVDDECEWRSLVLLG